MLLSFRSRVCVHYIMIYLDFLLLQLHSKWDSLFKCINAHGNSQFISTCPHVESEKPNVVILLLQAYTIFTHVCPHKKSCNVIHSYLAFVPVRQFLFFGTTYILYDDAISWFLCDHYTLFLNICVSQGSVAVQLMCGGIFSNLYLVQVFSITNFHGMCR